MGPSQSLWAWTIPDLGSGGLEGRGSGAGLGGLLSLNMVDRQHSSIPTEPLCEGALPAARPEAMGSSLAQ